MTDPATRNISEPDELRRLFPGVVVPEHHDHWQFRLLGGPPSWLLEVWPEVAEIVESESLLRPASRWPVLLRGLSDAEKFWADAEDGEFFDLTWPDTGEGEDFHRIACRVSLQEGRQLLFLIRSRADSDFLAARQREVEKLAEQVIRLRERISERELSLHSLIHEVVTPLASLQGSLQVLRDDGQLQQGHGPLADVAIRQVSRLQATVRAALDDLGAGSATNSSSDLNKAVQRAISELELSAAVRGVLLTHSTGPEPEHGCGWSVLAEPSRLDRIVFTAVDAVLSAAPPGTTLGVQAIADEQFVSVRVDTGGNAAAGAAIVDLVERSKGPVLGLGTGALAVRFASTTLAAWGGSLGCEVEYGAVCLVARLLPMKKEEPARGEGD